MSIIQRTQDFERVSKIPRRSWGDYGTEAAAILTKEFAKSWGRQELFPIQGAALADLANYRGLFTPIRVGGGKTLVTLLAPHVVSSQRPLLIVPARLVRKTEKAIEDLSWHWRVCRAIRIVSYESIGRVNGIRTLEDYRPDLVMADEAHKLKNLKAAVTRRVKRYMDTNHDVLFAGLSGTFERKSIKDYGHMLLWASRQSGYFPLPYSYLEMVEWSDCLDHKDVAERPSPGAFLSWSGADSFDPYVAAKRAFRERLISCPGVVASTASDVVDCSLLISDVSVDEPQPRADESIAYVRETFETEEGYALSEASQVWQQVRQRALGFYYRYIVPPPREWLDARREWACFVREEIKKGRLDSEKQVALHYPDCNELRGWREQRESFVPETEAVWIDDSVVSFVAKWLSKHPKGIAWVDYVEVGQRLEEISGRPFFSRQARDARGVYVEDAKGPIVASIHSVNEGLNLQYHWANNLMLGPMRNAGKMEQILGRTHRYGQPEDEVTCEFLVNCVEHIEAIQQNIEEASHVFDKMGDRYKILTCDLSLNVSPGIGGRWERPRK